MISRVCFPTKYEACWAGELSVCRWLYLNGAAGTVRANDNYSCENTSGPQNALSRLCVICLSFVLIKIHVT